MTVFAVFMVILSGCSVRRRAELKDADDTKGKRIAVKMGYDSDYYFSKTNDQKIIRYNTSADMILALKNKYVDAVAGTEVENNLILQVSSGLRMLPGEVDKYGNVFCVTKEDPQLLAELNEFLAEFMKTDEYADIERRFNESFDFEYEYKDIPLTGTGRTIRVTVDPFSYPFSYYDYDEEHYGGIEIEILSAFANSKGYRLEIVEDSAALILQRLINGTADIAACGFSDIYKSEAEIVDAYKMSEPYYFGKITLLVPDESAKMSLATDLNY